MEMQKRWERTGLHERLDIKPISPVPTTGYSTISAGPVKLDTFSLVFNLSFQGRWWRCGQPAAPDMKPFQPGFSDIDHPCRRFPAGSGWSSGMLAACDPISPGVLLDGLRGCGVGGTEELNVPVPKVLCVCFIFFSMTVKKKDGQSCEENMGSCCWKTTLFSMQNHCVICASLENPVAYCFFFWIH